MRLFALLFLVACTPDALPGGAVVGHADPQNPALDPGEQDPVVSVQRLSGDGPFLVGDTEEFSATLAAGMKASWSADAGELVQKIRELTVAAANGGYNPTNRTTIADQMRGLRDQLFSLANRADSNGIPLFGGLGSSGTPFTDATTGVTFNGIAGQRASTEITLPSAMDGQAIWMNVPSGNGTFNVTLGAANTGSGWAEPGQVVSPGALTGDNYDVTFNVVGAVTTYDIVDTTTATTVASAQPYVNGQAIQFAGMSFVAHGAPANGDVLQVSASTPITVFKALDDAIASITNAPGDNKLSQAVALALTQIDSSMDRIQAARGQAGAHQAGQLPRPHRQARAAEDPARPARLPRRLHTGGQRGHGQRHQALRVQGPRVVVGHAAGPERHHQRRRQPDDAVDQRHQHHHHPTPGRQ